MLRIREFEERVKRTFEDHPGVIRGHTHLADGAEASIVGSIANARPGRPVLHDVPLPRLPDRARHRPEGDDGRDLRPQGRALQGARRLDAPRSTSRAASSAPRGSSGRASRTRPARPGRAQIRGKGQVVLCFFGDGASKQGAFHESLNIASLWKLPIVFVMENNGYNVHTRTEQEDANARGRRAPVREGEGLQHARRDGRRRATRSRCTRRSRAAVARARAGEGPTLVESQMYRLSAHGNIIAPPGVPLHFPEHEAIEKFGAPEEYEAAMRGDPVPALPRPARRRRRRSPAEEADRDRRRGARGDAGRGRLRPREPVPRARDGPRPRLRLRRR